MLETGDEWGLVAISVVAANLVEVFKTLVVKPAFGWASKREKEFIDRVAQVEAHIGAVQKAIDGKQLLQEHRIGELFEEVHRLQLALKDGVANVAKEHATNDDIKELKTEFREFRTQVIDRFDGLVETLLANPRRRHRAD